MPFVLVATLLVAMVAGVVVVSPRVAAFLTQLTGFWKISPSSTA